jgi:hypothetical protein
MVATVVKPDLANKSAVESPIPVEVPVMSAIFDITILSECAAACGACLVEKTFA